MMQNHLRTLPELFAQLGLDETPEEFVRRHAPLAPDVALEEAPFWNDAQKSFLATELARRRRLGDPDRPPRRAAARCAGSADALSSALLFALSGLFLSVTGAVTASSSHLRGGSFFAARRLPVKGE
ncbi:MAG: DUF2789 family protein [Sphaerotilus natans]